MFEKLKQAGYTDEEAKKIEKIFNEHLDGNYVTKDRFNTINEDNKSLKKQIGERDKQLETLTKSVGDNEELKNQIETLKNENAAAKKQYEADLKASKTKAAVRSKIGDQAHDSDMVLSLLDLTKIELDDNDNVKTGFDDQFSALKKDKAFLFKSTDSKGFKFEGAKGVEGNKDGNDGSNNQGGFGAKLASMKVGISDANNRASDFYFKN